MTARFPKSVKKRMRPGCASTTHGTITTLLTSPDPAGGDPN
jgi:hypothetical protein